MSGLLPLLIEVRRDTYLAWAFLLFVLFGFYQLLTGNYLERAKSSTYVMNIAHEQRRPAAEWLTLPPMAEVSVLCQKRGSGEGACFLASPLEKPTFL